MTPEQIREIVGPVCSVERATVVAPHLGNMLVMADAVTVLRAAAMVAQVAWESGQFRLLVEDEDRAMAYEGRPGLGNVVTGDGVLYRGRGFIHITGRANYAECGLDLSLPLIEEPDLAAEPDVAARIAAWFWGKHKLNDLADEHRFRDITKIINGDATDGPPSYHLNRERYFNRSLAVLGKGVAIVAA